MIVIGFKDKKKLELVIQQKFVVVFKHAKCNSYVSKVNISKPPINTLSLSSLILILVVLAIDLQKRVDFHSCETEI